MADTFQLELVSPERLLLSRQVEMAVIPSAEGEMGVLPGHAPMVVALRGGVISVRENGAESERLFVAGGFAEVSPDRCTVPSAGSTDPKLPFAPLSSYPNHSRPPLTTTSSVRPRTCSRGVPSAASCQRPRSAVRSRPPARAVAVRSGRPR